MKKIIIINGPNINLLGKREPKIYGSKTLKTIIKTINKKFKNKKLKIKWIQSNKEYKIIKNIHKIMNIKSVIGLIINPAGFSYCNLAILDALIATKKQFIEIHLSNLYKREKFRQKSIFSKNAIAIITGMGYKGYYYAIHFILNNTNI